MYVMSMIFNYLFDKLYENEKLELVLDYQKSRLSKNANCHEINSLPAKIASF